MLHTTANSTSLSVRFINSALDKVELDKDQLSAILHTCRIPPHLLKEPNACISLQQFANLLNALENLVQDDFLGQSATPQPKESFALMCHWLIASKNLEECIERFLSFHRLALTSLRFDYLEEAGSIALSLSMAKDGEAVGLYLAEYTFFRIHRLFSWLIKDNIRIRRLDFNYKAPSHVSDYRPIFYGAPTHFSCKHCAIHFPADIIHNPVRQNLSTLQDFLKDSTTSMLMQNFAKQSWTTRIAKEIGEELSHLPSLPDIAKRFDTKPYTLQRRLSEEGVTYSDIKNQLKRDTAIELLTNSHLSIEEISLQLGFSEISPFTRSFKNWTGIPPSAYRKYQ